MKRTSFAEADCPIARSLDQIGEWWTLLIIRNVFYGIKRFDGLLTHLEISRNVLTDRLQTLVESGLLEKRPYQEKPPRFEYHLTEKGEELYPILISYWSWGDKWLPKEQTAKIKMLHENCGEMMSPTLVCSSCQEPLSPHDVKYKVGLRGKDVDLQQIQEMAKGKVKKWAVAKRKIHKHNRLKIIIS